MLLNILVVHQSHAQLSDFQYSNPSFALQSSMQLSKTTPFKNKFSLASNRIDEGITPYNYRERLIGATTLLSATVYGLGIPLTVKLEPRQAIGAWLFSTATGFLVPWYMSRGKVIGQPELNYYMHGASRGLLRGFAFASDYNQDTTASVLLTAGFSLGESILKYYLGRKYLNENNAIAIGAMGDYGMLLGYGLAKSHHIRTINNLGKGKDREDIKTVYGLGTLIGGALGEYAGYKMASNNQYDVGNSHLLRNFQLLSFYFSLSLEYARREKILNESSKVENTDPEESTYLSWDRAYYTFLATSIPATILGHYINTKIDLNRRQGLALTGLNFAGALVGLSFALMIENEDYYTNTYSVAIFTGAGAAMGLYLLQKNRFLNKLNHKKEESAIHNLRFEPSLIPFRNIQGQEVAIGYQPGLSLKFSL